MNLFTQFKKLANVYFLIIAGMQCVQAISITGGQPVQLLPLVFVICVSMVKDAFEDYKRAQSDKEENTTTTLVYDSVTKNFVTREWQEIICGDILKIKEG